MHVFVQHLDGKRVRELHWRDDEPRHGVGFVVRSAYFPKRRGWWSRIFGGAPTWQLPFDEDGTDRLGLTQHPVGLARRIVGTVQSDEAELVVRDAWCDAPVPWRAAHAREFLVEPDEGPPVIVSLGLAPLVIAPCRRAEGFVDQLTPRHRSLVPSRLARDDAEASIVEIRVGDVVEVIGISRPIQQSARRLDRVGYRDAARPYEVIGDEDGTRVVIRLR